MTARPASEVMRLAYMGASFPTRLSFLRTLVRALHGEAAEIVRPVWEISEKGFGHAVYSVNLGGYRYSLVAFARDLPDEMRTDRVIATAWDAAFVLFDGVPGPDDIKRLEAQAPLQEAGRFADRDLVLSRANKSVRFFEDAVRKLRSGGQPDAGMVRDIGYAMRTTAVYGNGKFGLADRDRIATRPVMRGPFMAEMLTVYLIRGFTHDLLEHLGGAEIDRALKRHLGIGNSTGLGMAPFLVSHPILLNNWVRAKEEAFVACLALAEIDERTKARTRELAGRVSRHLEDWNVPDQEYTERIRVLRQSWPTIMEFLDGAWPGREPFRALAARAHGLGNPELGQLVDALILEACPAVVDQYALRMDCLEEPTLDPRMSLALLRQGLDDNFGWALDIDFDDPLERHRFWYVSEEKLEPRLGDRYSEPGAELESPLDIAIRVQALRRDLGEATDSLAEFLIRHPRHRFAVRRVQTLMAHPYSEIRDNLTAHSCRPIDMLRFKLAMFGASKFDPKSDRWTRITLAQGAPLFDELGNPDADDWWLPVFGA